MMKHNSNARQAVLAAAVTAALFSPAEAAVTWSTVCAAGGCSVNLIIEAATLFDTTYQDLDFCKALCEGTTGCAAVTFQIWGPINRCSLHTAQCPSCETAGFTAASHYAVSGTAQTSSPVSGGWTEVSSVFVCLYGQCTGASDNIGSATLPDYYDLDFCRRWCQGTTGCKAVNYFSRIRMCQMLNAHGCPVQSGTCYMQHGASYHELADPDAATLAPAPGPWTQVSDVYACQLSNVFDGRHCKNTGTDIIGQDSQGSLGDCKASCEADLSCFAISYYSTTNRCIRHSAPGCAPDYGCVFIEGASYHELTGDRPTAPTVAPTGAPTVSTDAPTDAPTVAPGCPASSIRSTLFPSVCCPATCGFCGGTGCKQAPGGKENCCAKPILRSGTSCSTSGPPCVLSTPGPTTTPATCCSILDTEGRATTKRKPQSGDETLLWIGAGSSMRHATPQTHDPDVELFLPPGSTSPGGYLYDAEFYMFGHPELREPGHCLGTGLKVTVTCIGTPHCAVYVFVYHQPPFTANTTGGFPELANAGWQARGRCSPRFGNDTGACPMLGLRYNLMDGEDVPIEQAPATDLQYFLIVVVPRKNCGDNTLTNEAQCTNVPQSGLATTCVWNSGTNTCEDDWCPPRTPGPPSSGGGGGSPTQCPVDLDCSDA